MVNWLRVALASNTLESFTEQKCTAELARILETSPKVAKLLQGIFALNKQALRRGITCRPCKGTEQAVICEAEYTKQMSYACMRSREWAITTVTINGIPHTDETEQQH